MNDIIYTLAQIKEAWEKYRDKANTVLQVLKDGKWEIAPKPHGHLGGVRARRVPLGSTMTFPDYLEKCHE